MRGKGQEIAGAATRGGAAAWQNAERRRVVFGRDA
jgi:hypothetical protein